jgi:uncharacterized membrane protein
VLEFFAIAIVFAMFIRPLRLPATIFWAAAWFFLSGPKHEMDPTIAAIAFGPLALTLLVRFLKSPSGSVKQVKRPGAL